MLQSFALLFQTATASLLSVTLKIKEAQRASLILMPATIYVVGHFY